MTDGTVVAGGLFLECQIGWVHRAGVPLLAGTDATVPFVVPGMSPIKRSLRGTRDIQTEASPLIFINGACSVSQRPMAEGRMYFNRGPVMSVYGSTTVGPSTTSVGTCRVPFLRMF